MVNETISHYLVGCYTTHQPDGVQIEATLHLRGEVEGVG